MARANVAMLLARRLDDVRRSRQPAAVWLAAHPDLNGEVAELVALAARLQRLRQPAPDPLRKIAARRALVEALKREPRAISWWRRPRALLSSLRRLALPAAAALVVAIATGGGLAVAAAQAALPGDALYSVKLASEDLRVSAATDGYDRAELRLWASNRRLEEIERAVSLSEEARAVEAARLHELMVEQAGVESEAWTAHEPNAAGLLGELDRAAQKQRTAAALAAGDPELLATLERARISLDETRSRIAQRLAAPIGEAPRPASYPSEEREHRNRSMPEIATPDSGRAEGQSDDRDAATFIVASATPSATQVALVDWARAASIATTEESSDHDRRLGPSRRPGSAEAATASADPDRTSEATPEEREDRSRETATPPAAAVSTPEATTARSLSPPAGSRRARAQSDADNQDGATTTPIPPANRTAAASTGVARTVRPGEDRPEPEMTKAPPPPAASPQPTQRPDPTNKNGDDAHRAATTSQDARRPAEVKSSPEPDELGGR
jgi:hypothetical protein